jgi:RNA polymerase sigma-70 factor (ECF subfamily)
MHVTDEKELVRLAQRDPEAFAKIYEDHHHRIFQYALKRTGNVQVAQDITSETFLKALQKLWQFRWRNVSFSSWLYRIATNEANQYFRKRRYTAASLDELRQSGFEPVSESSPETEIIAAQERLEQHSDFLACQKIISQMDIKYQEVLCLRFLERKQLNEIAEILGKSEGTIKSLLHRGLEKLRSEISAGTRAQPFSGSRIIVKGQHQTVKAIKPS